MNRAGFALPAVLGLVAVLALVVLSAATALTAGRAAAQAALQRADFERGAMTAEARALFLVATSAFAADGLQPAAETVGPSLPSFRPAALRLDGRFYALDADGGLAISLQDEAGLMNLNASRPDALMRLMARLRFSGAEAETLRDRLLDALDADERERPRGLERAGYLARGLAPPSPGGFADLAELAQIPGWEAMAAGDRRKAVAEMAVAVRGSSAFNVNTAPPAVLELVLAVPHDVALRIVQARETRPIQTLTQLGLPGAEPGAAATRPGGTVRLIVADRRRGFTYASRLTPGAGADGPPWRAGSMVLSREQGVSDRSHGPVLPDPTAAPPER